MKSFQNKLYWIPIVIFMVGIFYSCENNLDKVKKIAIQPDSPDETSEDLHVIYTDSGMAQIEIFSHIAETYTLPKEKTKFKDGLKVNFYSNDGEIEATLTSLYGEIDKKTGNITVKDSVEMVNLAKQKTLKSEVLYWDKGGDSIYTDKPVVITSPDMILSGVGAWATPNLDTAQFYNPTAKIYLNE